MNLRERLADWISGGELSRLEGKLMELELRTMCFFLEDETKQDEALRKIAACETPGANATVRRMARIAREALQ